MDILHTIGTTVLPALLPGVGNLITALGNRIGGGALPVPRTVEERVQLVQAETARLEALARLDTVGNVHLWVNDVRGLQRPVGAALVIAGLLWVVNGQDATALQIMGDLATSVIFYLFGDRTTLHYKRKG